VRRTIASVGIVTAALAAAVGVSGCGGGGLDGSAVAQASQSTQAAGTARVSVTANAAGMTLHGGGFVDMRQRAADMSLSLPQGTVQEITRGTRLYLKLPPALRDRSVAKTPWVTADLGAVARARGIDLGSLQSFGDPNGTLDQLSSAGQVERVGTETVRGVKTTHFKAIVDLRKAAAHAPAEQMIKLLGRSSLPVEVWLDDQKRAAPRAALDPDRERAGQGDRRALRLRRRPHHHPASGRPGHRHHRAGDAALSAIAFQKLDISSRAELATTLEPHRPRQPAAA
jgi:hypothetical protein